MEFGKVILIQIGYITKIGKSKRTSNRLKG